MMRIVLQYRVIVKILLYLFVCIGLSITLKAQEPTEFEKLIQLKHFTNYFDFTDNMDMLGFKYAGKSPRIPGNSTRDFIYKRNFQLNEHEIREEIRALFPNNDSTQIDFSTNLTNGRIYYKSQILGQGFTQNLNSCNPSLGTELRLCFSNGQKTKTELWDLGVDTSTIVIIIRTSK